MIVTPDSYDESAEETRRAKMRNEKNEKQGERKKGKNYRKTYLQE